MAELAFAGAMGYGQYAAGGRGGQTLTVTNLNDDGPGSLREALQAPYPRIVEFAVEGLICLERPIFVDNPYLTLTGATAPGNGVQVRLINWDKSSGSCITIRTHDVIVRYLRLRPGAGGMPDALTIVSEEGHTAHDIIIDHCSLQFAVDKTFEITGPWNAVPPVARSYNITLQNSIVALALHYSTHDEGGHSKGSTLLHCENVSVIRNLYALNQDRNPLLHIYGRADVVNNLIYVNNYGWCNVTKIENHRIPPGAPQYYNLIRNQFVYGPAANMDELEIAKQSTPLDPVPDSDIQIYLYQNRGPHRPDDTYPENALYGVVDWPNTVSTTQYLTAKRHPGPIPGSWQGNEIEQKLLAGVGATLPVRDALDELVIRQVKERTGKIINDPIEVGGWLQAMPVGGD